MKNQIKSTLKHLAEEIWEVLNDNAESNEMAALIDYGEWSQSGPNFESLIEKWKLDRPTLSKYCDVAQYYADTYEHMKPKTKFTPRHPGDYPTNPWEERMQAFHCIFMAGYLQPEEIDQPEHQY